jgi:predicted dehydrogenase
VVVAVGLAGAGRRAREVHAPALSSLPEFRFVGVWARGENPAKQLAEQHGVQHFTHFDDMLAAVDAVSFAIPPPAQPVYGGPALLKGKPALFEVPLAGDEAGAHELEEAVLRHKVVTQMAFTWRYASAVREFLAEQVPRTEPLGGRGHVVSGTLAGKPSSSPWRLERGVLVEQGPHLLDLLDAALGQILAVRAHGDTLGWLGLMLEHKGGRSSEASMTAVVPVARPVAVVDIYGTAGEVGIDCVQAVNKDTYATMFREFAQAVESGTPPPLDVMHGARMQRVLEAAETDLVSGL